MGYGRITSLTLIDGRVWCCTDSGVIVWNYETHEIIKKIEGDHSGKVFGACKVGCRVWTYAWDSRICVYNEETLEYIGAAPRYHSDAIGGLACIYDKNFDCWRVFSSSWDQSVTVWLSKAKEEEKEEEKEEKEEEEKDEGEENTLTDYNESNEA